MKPKLSEWANLAEVVGAFAVVVSLAYVGIQVNDSTAAVRAASANDANVALQSWYLEIGSDQQTSMVFYKALTSPKPLSNGEEFQFLMMLHGAFLAFQNSYFASSNVRKIIIVIGTKRKLEVCGQRRRNDSNRARRGIVARRVKADVLSSYPKNVLYTPIRCTPL